MSRWHAFIIIRRIMAAFFATAFALVQAAEGTMTIVLTQPYVMDESRGSYDREAIKLALEKTQNKYGNFEIKLLPLINGETINRILHTNDPQNLFIDHTYFDNDPFLNNKIFIAFPHDLGILGYRVCFTNTTTKKMLAEQHSLEDIKQLKIGVGTRWTDGKILNNNGFKTSEFESQINLFKVVASGRVDLFCRGTNEFLSDYTQQKETPHLDYDETFAIFYPFPRFFYTNKNNMPAKNRLEEGFKIAYKDGSLKALWLKYNSDSLNFVKLKKRKIYKIENPLTQTLSQDYLQYVIDPSQL